MGESKSIEKMTDALLKWKRPPVHSPRLIIIMRSMLRCTRWVPRQQRAVMNAGSQPAFLTNTPTRGQLAHRWVNARGVWSALALPSPGQMRLHKPGLLHLRPDHQNPDQYGVKASQRRPNLPAHLKRNSGPPQLSSPRHLRVALPAETGMRSHGLCMCGHLSRQKSSLDTLLQRLNLPGRWMVKTSKLESERSKISKSKQTPVPCMANVSNSNP